MKTETKPATDIPCLEAADQRDHVQLVPQIRPVRLSQTQSNPVQPNPTTPPPPGKGIGKETVNFLAVFDHACLSALSSMLLLRELKFRLSAPDLDP
jgi:hypothetical protein